MYRGVMKGHGHWCGNFNERLLEKKRTGADIELINQVIQLVF